MFKVTGDIVILKKNLLHLIHTIWFDGLCVVNGILHCIVCHIYEWRCMSLHKKEKIIIIIIILIQDDYLFIYQYTELTA